MKKLLSILCFLLMFSLLLSPTAFAAGGNTDTLADWNIKITVPDDAVAVLKGGEYYLYAQKEGSIPYVMLTTYRYSSLEKFIADFTAYMQKQHSDLKILSEAAPIRIGDKDCCEIDFGYKVSGYDVLDRRIVLFTEDRTYLFASKEVEALNMTVGGMLEDVIANCELLTGEEAPLPELEEDYALAFAYLYCQDDGMPKYWLDFTGAMADTPVLHCYFRSGEPSFYEQCFLLDLNSADVKDNQIRIYKVTDLAGNDCSSWFKSLLLVLDEEEVLLRVSRDDRTLAGGGDDNILTGVYPMRPMGADVRHEYYKDDGQLKYWLDSDGEDLLLHALFRSGDPEYYEEVFTLDLGSAKSEGDYTLSIRKVYNSAGEDVSAWFRSLSLTEVQGAFIMKVDRDESTLAGGSDDNILSGVYLLEPHSWLRPLEDGPYDPEELGQMAQYYYFFRNGFFPPEVDVEETDEGYSIHLYEIVGQGRQAHTATSAWYTVDEYGVGLDDLFGDPVDLCA